MNRREQFLHCPSNPVPAIDAFSRVHPMNASFDSGKSRRRNIDMLAAWGNLLDAKVRDAVRKFEGGKVTALYESASATDYR